MRSATQQVARNAGSLQRCNPSQWYVPDVVKAVDKALSLSTRVGSEDRILRWVRCIVEEAFAVVDFDDDDGEPSLDPTGLSLAVLKIWAHFFKSNTQWPFINIIGASLEKYREMLIGSNRPRG